MAQGRPAPLPHVLQDLALVKRGLVLMRGSDYWRIEDAASRARREAASGPVETRAFLSDPRFYWTKDQTGKVVVMEVLADAEVPFSVEPGAIVPVPG
jgi:hypothetical protein